MEDTLKLILSGLEELKTDVKDLKIGQNETNKRLSALEAEQNKTNIRLSSLEADVKEIKQNVEFIWEDISRHDKIFESKQDKIIRM